MSDSSPVVLLVEDEPSLIEIYRHWLSDSHTIRTAQTGDGALELVDEDVDVIVLDRLLPSMTGREVIEHVRERELECKIVMATAVESNFDLIEAGADAAITKPITKDELLRAVDQMLDQESYLETEQQLFELLERRASLYSTDDLDVETIEAIDADIETLQRDLDERTAAMDDGAFISLLRHGVDDCQTERSSP